MNPTLQKFAYPANLVADYAHWAVLIRPQQVTYGNVVLAAKSHGVSFGDLTPAEGAELPSVIRDYERTLSRLLPVEKFNYLALMMVDPNPHFHALPRYAMPIIRDGRSFVDITFPRPPDLSIVNEVDAAELELIRRHLAVNWTGSGSYSSVQCP